MSESLKDIEIAGNIKCIELLKVELLENVAGLFAEILSEGDSDVKKRISASGANIINLTYILAKRLGISYEEIQKSMIDGLKTGIENGHRIEKKYSDLSELLSKIGGGEIKDE